MVATWSASLLGDGVLGDDGCGAEILAAATVASASGKEVSVASSDPTGSPQAEQNRLASGSSALQVAQRGINFSAD
jgi:hypothetical protein